MPGTEIMMNGVDLVASMARTVQKNGSYAMTYDYTNPPISVERSQYDAIVRRCLPVHAGAKTDAWNRNYDEWGGFGGFNGLNCTKKWQLCHNE